MLFTVSGFEIGLAYTTVITASGAWAEVQRLVTSHDRPGVDLLLISAGAPDRHGNVYPAEEALAAFLLNNPVGLTQAPVHIKQVVLHSWSSGWAALLHPDMAKMFGPLYEGLVPPHHGLAPRL